MGQFDGTLRSFLIGDARSGDGFFGLTSATPFQSVTFSTDAGSFFPFGTPTVSTQAKNFSLDDLVTGDMRALALVPLPASALMLLSGLGLISAMRMRRRCA
ncbi:MAG: hypothetical protein ACJAVR_003696 [Paracoccaceae bacterium]